ncbi:hypothetical protein KZO98_06745 [Bifidobacterium pseudocatenulatum]|uniref:hypothetical protein n=1 Tax=Bifidobacterium pseudocatenulatum TaxID=28026 RepID=UPI001CF9380C|nr:hypothetical protein [Bifidobacterium pseudocatenulatum]MCB4896375.1 hypothetical protein [Bifidobacterium pseudocatenulatum]
MIQNVSSATPLEKVDYHLRDDGLADIRIRRNIRTVTHEATENQPEYVEYTAVESYQVLPLMEQEAIEQADSLFAGDATSSRPVFDRVSALEQASLDNAQLLADLMAGGDGDATDSTDSDTGKTDEKNAADDSADSKDKE